MDLQFVKLTSFSNLAEAQIFSSLLQKNGIESELRNEYMSQILPFASHDIVMHVSVSSIDEARDLLEAWKAAGHLYQYKQEDQKKQEPKSLRLLYYALFGFFVALVFLYLIKNYF